MTRAIRTSSLLVVAVLTLVLAGGSPIAQAGGKFFYRPDGTIRAGATGFIGGGIYNTTGDGQRKTRKVRPGHSDQFTVRLINSGNASDEFFVDGDPADPGFTVKYTADGSDVTADVISGTFITPGMAPGDSTDLIVKVTVKKSVKIGTATAFGVLATSEAAEGQQDLVVARVLVSDHAGDAGGHRSGH